MATGLRLEPTSDGAAWNGLFADCVEVDFQQSWEYGESIRDCIGWEPTRLLVLQDKTPVALAQTLVKQSPMMGNVARIQHGPLFLKDTFSPQLAVDVMTALRAHWVEDKGYSLRTSPCLLKDTLPDNWESDARYAPVDEITWSSIRIDLSQSEDAMLAAMRRSWRQQLSRTKKYGLEISKAQTEDDWSFFLEKYQETTAAKKISWPSTDLMRAVHAHAPERFELHFASLKGERLAAMTTISCGVSHYSFAGWFGPRSNDFHANMFLYWRTLLMAKERGLAWYDLYGIDPVNLPGITHFKRGVGGLEYSFEGTFEAQSDNQANDADYLKDHGHLFYGLGLPAGEGLSKLKEQVAALVLSFVREHCQLDVESLEGVSLIDGGVIDSLSLISLVVALQKQFDVSLSPQDISIDNFDRVESISQLVYNKSAEEA